MPGLTAPDKKKEQEDVFQLTAEQKEAFERDGLIVLRNFFTPSCAAELLREAHRLLEEDLDLEGHPMTLFETDEAEDKKHVGDDYFLTSGDKIRYFFEPDAFSPSSSSDPSSNGTGVKALNRPKELAVNKIGHCLHELNPIYREFTLLNPSIHSVTRSLGTHKDPRVIQSMVICKQAEVGGAVHAHDDSTFLYTKPLSALGFWAALEPCTADNGCLSFVPGSHKRNKIHRRLVRLPEGGTGFTTLLSSSDDYTPPDWDKEEWVSAPCQPGDMVLIHGEVIHRSEANKSEKSRFIYTFHLVEGSAEWDERNWLQPTKEMPFSKLFADAS